MKQLGRRTAGILCGLVEILEDAGVPFAVIGASALLLHGVRLVRTTRDLDLAMAVEGGLGAVRPILLEAGLEDTRIAHRFRMPGGDEIDVLAVDPSHTPMHEILLSPGDRIEAIGLPEAVWHAAAIPLAGCAVPVAPLALLVAIKLHAATSETRPHDLADACVALTGYEAFGPRRYGIDYERFPALTFETAGAYLAGADAAQLVRQPVAGAIDRAIETLLKAPQLSDRFAGGEARRALVRAYQAGLQDAESVDTSDTAYLG